MHTFKFLVTIFLLLLQSDTLIYKNINNLFVTVYLSPAFFFPPLFLFTGHLYCLIVPLGSSRIWNSSLSFSVSFLSFIRFSLVSYRFSLYETEPSKSMYSCLVFNSECKYWMKCNLFLNRGTLCCPYLGSFFYLVPCLSTEEKERWNICYQELQIHGIRKCRCMVCRPGLTFCPFFSSFFPCFFLFVWLVGFWLLLLIFWGSFCFFFPKYVIKSFMMN